MELKDEVKNDRRSIATPNGVINDTHLMDTEIEERAWMYVHRLLCGAAVQEGLMPGHVHIRSKAQEFVLSEKAYTIYQRIADRIKNEELDLRGINPPYDVEDVIRIIESSKRFAKQECRSDPSKLRVFYLRQDNGGCGFYRVIQPVRALDRLCPGIHAEEANWLRYDTGQYFDVLVAPRMADMDRMAVLKNLQKVGKVVVYESDDLLQKIPEWNPYKEYYTPDLKHFLARFIDQVDALTVSTPELRDSIGRQDQSFVCPNFIDPELWPMKVKEQPPLRGINILWAGSNTHENDLELVVPAIKRIIKKYRQRVNFIFVGYAPSKFTCGYDVGGRIQRGIDPQYKHSLQLINGCTVFEWPAHLARQNAHVALAPLIDEDFNRAKSELKVLEAWALGIPIIAADVAPYWRAMSVASSAQGRMGGILVKPEDADGWYRAMCKLIDDADERTAEAEAGLAELKRTYVAEVAIRAYEQALLTIARGKTVRPECNAAIKARLEEMGWA